MICPRCGLVDKNIPVPEITREAMKLGTCKKCKTDVYCIPTQKKSESSQSETVETGEKRELPLTNIYLNYNEGSKSRKRPGASDIDREILDEEGNVIYYFEIKERSNTINAYNETQFPYAKIDDAKRLIGETGKPVCIVLKFADCWGRIKVEQGKNYKKGNQPFAPRYRPGQMSKQRQVPVQIPVEELEVLKIRDECEEKFSVQ